MPIPGAGYMLKGLLGWKLDEEPTEAVAFNDQEFYADTRG